MKFIIYLDSFFMMNFVMDIISLISCSMLIHRRFNIFRIITAAVTGSAYACVHLMYLRGTGIIAWLLTYVIICTVMVFAAFGDKTLKGIVRNVLMLYITIFIMGGMANVLYFRMGIKNMPFLFILTGVAGISVSGFLSRKVNCLSRCAEVILNNRGEEVRIMALVDSGNLLREPYSGRCVNVLSYECAGKLMEGDDIYRQKGYMKIPYSSIGNESGMMDGFEIDEMTVCYRDKKYFREKVIVGIYKGKKAFGDEYEMILNPEELGK